MRQRTRYYGWQAPMRQAADSEGWRERGYTLEAVLVNGVDASARRRAQVRIQAQAVRERERREAERERERVREMLVLL